MVSLSNPIDAYAISVAEGKTVGGKLHRLACERHLQNRRDEGKSFFPFQFQQAKADRFFRFAGRLKHYKGEWAGQFISLTDCQKFRLGSVYGWTRNDNGLRRFRTSYNEIPRKQGKSLEAAIVVVYTTFYDDPIEPGAEGYCSATKRDQALIVFGDAKKLVASSGLKDRIKVRVGSLYVESTSSKLQPLSSDYDSMDGLNVSVCALDELHAHKTRGMLDVLETAMGARRQPLMFQITTAGDDLVSVCGDQHEYVRNVLEGTLTDESFFGFVASADAGDDWEAEATWKKANPHYGISVKPDDMKSLATKAKGIPSAAASFKQKRLNLWVNASAPCLSVDGWKQGQSSWAEDEMVGQACYVGIDLASTIDLCSLSYVFPPTATRPTWRAIQRIWTPGDTLKDRAHRDRAPYDIWVEQGWMIAPDGTSIDHDLIRQDILANRKRFKIKQIGFDPWHADTPVKNLTALDGFPEDQVLAVPQTYSGMSAACLRIQAEILAGKVDARGCPMTALSVSNTVDNPDNKGNTMFTKKKSRGRIDPVMSITVGMALAIRVPDKPVRRAPFVALV